MNMTKLDTKYRPQSLDEILGQSEEINTLKGRLQSGNLLGNSILISGPTGVGKTSLARIIARYINCEKFDRDKIVSCGECIYCCDPKEAASEINFSSEGIDTARAMKEAVGYVSMSNGHVFILDEMQGIRKDARESMLKILEEPPRDTTFILVTTEPDKLPETIKDRCYQINLSLVYSTYIEELLKRIVNNERLPFEIPDAAIEIVAEECGGTVRRAIQYLQKVIDSLYYNPQRDVSDYDLLRKFLDLPILLSTSEATNLLIKGVYQGNEGIAVEALLEIVKAKRENKSLFQVFKQIREFHLQAHLMQINIDQRRRIPIKKQHQRFCSLLHENLGNFDLERSGLMLDELFSRSSMDQIDLVALTTRIARIFSGKKAFT